MVNIFLKKLITPMLLVCMGFMASARAESEIDKHLYINALIEKTEGYLNTAPEKTVASLLELKELQSAFNETQTEKYYLVFASSLGFRGKHRERVDWIQSKIDKVTSKERRVKFLYQLTDSYTNLGEYENALIAMNKSVVLSLNIADIGTKITTYQAAITFYISLQAYDEAMIYAQRMGMLTGDKIGLRAKCYSLVNQIEIGFLRRERQSANSLMVDAVHACDAADRKIFSLIVKTLSAIDLIDFGSNEKGLAASLPLLLEFSTANQTSDYVPQLKEAIARAYLGIGDVAMAERYARQSYESAKSESVVQLMEKTSETLAVIYRTQGRLADALKYYDINLGLKKKMLNEQMQKNVAYQRVKFDTQDKTNQLVLAEQKNKTLIVEKALQQGRNQNLLLFITLGLILLAVLGAWLARTWQQKNLFRTSSQTDGLTHVSNRAHFMACATHAFKDVRNEVSVVLFDMDFFKKINDAFGHAAGDWVLKTVCDVVKAQLLKSDVLGRLGGEEFAICLVGMTPEEVLALAERCRVAIAAVDTTPSGFIFDLSASFGIATRPAHALSPFEEVLAAADKALYLSKNEGRNRVSFHR